MTTKLEKPYAAKRELTAAGLYRTSLGSFAQVTDLGSAHLSWHGSLSESAVNVPWTWNQV